MRQIQTKIKTIANIGIFAVVFFFGHFALADHLNQTTGPGFADAQVGDPSFAAVGLAVHTTSTLRLTSITLQIRQDPGSISSATDTLNVSVYAFSNTSSAPTYPLSNTDPNFVGESSGINWAGTSAAYTSTTWNFSTNIDLSPTMYYQLWVHRTGAHTSDNSWDVKIFINNTTDDHTITRRFGAYELTGSVFSGEMFYVTSTLGLADDAYYDNSVYGPPNRYFNFGITVDPDHVPGSFSSLGVRFTPTVTYQTKHLSFRMDRLTNSFDFGNIYAKIYTYDGTTGRGTQVATSTALTTNDIPQSFGDPLTNLAKVTFAFTSTLTFTSNTAYNIVIEPTNYASVSSTNPIFPALNLGIRDAGGSQSPMLHNDPLANPSLTSFYSTSTHWLLSDYPFLSTLFATTNEFQSNVPGGSSFVSFYSTSTSFCQNTRQWKLNTTFGNDSIFQCQASGTCSVGVAWNGFAANTSTYALNNNDIAFSAGSDLASLSTRPYYMPMRFTFGPSTTFNARAYLCDGNSATTCRLDLAASPLNTHIIAYSDNWQFTVKDPSDVACSSSIGFESPNEVTAGSPVVTQNTALTDLYNQALAQCDAFGQQTPVIGGVVQGLCRVLMTLFIPSQSSFDTLLSLRTAVANKPPFGYYNVYISSLQGIESSTSTAAVVSDSDVTTGISIFSGIGWYQTWMIIIRALLWVAFGFGVIKFFKYFTPNS